MDRKPLRRGSVKEIYDLGQELEFRFTDRISVFDKVIPSLIPYKGETLCREGIYWFQRAKKMGIPTHFVKFIAPNGMLVKKVDVINPENIASQSKNYLIPLEVICRWYVAGSLYDRVKQCEIDSQSLGFSRGHTIKYGEPLPDPYIEVSTKLERVDRLLDRSSALELSGLTLLEYDEITEMVLRIDEDIRKEVEPRGLIHVDGKKEFAFDEDRNIMVVDIYGTADEDRFWDKDKYEEGEFVNLSKEHVRQYYRRTGFKDQLYDARKMGSSEPDIPPLPDDVIEETREIYVRLFQMITGEQFESSV
ncbi:MAG: phosphoribosylaminoimidazolesuccinocarboxamide synthase [Methanotrichaceae archaeon]